MTSAATHARGLSVFRGIVKELQQRNLIKTASYNYVVTKYKANQITGARHCREQLAASHDASTYFCLLRSTREYEELCKKYHGDGEDTLEKAAARVGLGLPEEYKETDNNKFFSNEDSDK